MSKNDKLVTPRCPIRTTLELLGGKWKLLIIHQLAGHRWRLSELKRQIPDISEKMLIQELKVLSDSNLVNRINYGEVPPRVEYELTEAGEKVIPLIGHIRDFGLDYQQMLINQKN